MIKYTHIRFNWAIKKLLKSKENFGILEGFLSELLKEDISIQEILEYESMEEAAIYTLYQVGILVKDANGELIIVEIRNILEYHYFYKIVYNKERAVIKPVDKGVTYNKVKKVITVSVVYFDWGQGRDYVYHGATTFKGIHQQDVLELTEKQEKVFDLPTVPAIYPDHYIIKVNDFDDNARDGLDQWIYFLKNSAIKDEFNAKGLAEAREKLRESNLPEKERAVYLRSFDDLRDLAGIAETVRIDLEWAQREGMEKGMKEGIEKSMEKGMKKKAIEVALKLKQKGIDAATISEISGLSIEEIEKL